MTMPQLPILAPNGAFLTRIAAAVPPEDDEGMSTGRKALIGAAAASPFAGLIGQQPMQHDPLQGAKGKNYASMEELARDAQPGDVLLTSKPKGSMFKNVIMPLGNSQLYHAQAVTRAPGGMGRTLSVPDLFGEDIPEGQGHHYDYAIPEYMADPNVNYDSAVMVRPKTPMTPEQLEVFQKAVGERATHHYDSSKALGTFFRDMFVPKVPWLQNHRPDTVCEGNVCSTVPAQAYHEATGKRVVPNKPAQDTFPTDFLRSNEYELVGSHISPEVRALENTPWRKIAPLAIRGGVGLGMAGLAAGATEQPEVAGGVGGVLGTNALLNRVVPTPVEDAAPLIPSYMDVLHHGEQFGGEGLTSAPARKEMARFLTRRVPLLAAGGAAGAGAVHLARKAYEDHQKKTRRGKKK